MIRVRFFLVLVPLLLAGCAGVDKTSMYTSTGQRVDFLTSKSSVLGSAPTTLVVMQDRPGARVLRPVGVIAGQAPETALIGGIANGAGLAVGGGIAAKLVGNVSGGGASAGSIFIQTKSIAGGATVITH